MPVSMTQKEREAVAAIQTAAQALARAVELAERAEYGDAITGSLTEAQKHLVYALAQACAARAAVFLQQEVINGFHE